MFLWYNLLWFYKRFFVLWFDNIYGVIINLSNCILGCVVFMYILRIVRFISFIGDLIYVYV